MIRLPRRLFTDLVPKNSGSSFIKNLKQKFITRPVIYRLLILSSVMLCYGTYYISEKKTFTLGRAGKYWNTSRTYYQPSEVIERGVGINQERFYLIGVVKPGTIKVEAGSLKHSFVITDFIHEVKIYYDGILPPTMREGETSRVQGEFVNEFNPTEFVACHVESNHDAEVTKVSYKARSRDIELKQRPLNS